MEEILDKLDERYKGFLFDVDFVDFRKYKITGYELSTEELHKIEFVYTYNVNFTFDYNMSIICYNIDKQILKLFKKEEI